MKLEDYTEKELQAMSYDDIAFIVLTEKNQKMKINELFKLVAEVYHLSEDAFISQIGDFFELLSTDQRFIMLEDGYWDLKSKHSTKIIIEEDEEEMLADALEEDEEEILETEEDEEDIFYDTDEDTDADDDLQDLVVVDDEDEEAIDLI